MQQPRMRVRFAVLLAMGGCNVIAGIRGGTLAEEGTIVVCASLEDCQAAVPECRTAVGCENGFCKFEDALEGTPLPEQIQGNCSELVCDGNGKAKLIPAPADARDDGNVCTADSCNGMTPAHTVQQAVPCYTGLAATDGTGLCKKGLQHCDMQGNPMGGCEGEIVPQAEVCEAAEQDEDCDGKVNEEGANCVCGDGYLSAGEQCDDGNVVPSDLCTAECKVAVCGDGVVQPVTGESCDDGGTTDGDNCSANCQKQTVLQVDGGNYHTCAILNNGGVKCWGANVEGELGLGDTNMRGDEPTEMGDSLARVSLGSGKLATAITAGDTHTCAILNDGSVKCWGGGNHIGQLGLGNTTPRGIGPNEMGDDLPPVSLGTGKTATAIAAGDYHTCAILNDGNVKCWGRNNYGQLGLGDEQARGDGPNEMGDNLPIVSLGIGKTATAIATGVSHSCALLNDGSVKCWGLNGWGQLGLGDISDRGDGPNEMGNNLPAVNLGAGKTGVAITAGWWHTCAILNDGTVKCWGQGSQLGLGDTSNRGDEPSEMGDNLPPVNLGTGKTAVAIAGGGFHTCAVLNDQSIKCWGGNGNGELGLGDTANRGDGPNEMGNYLPPVDIGTGNTVVALSSGGYHTCALLSNDSVKCWGWNYMAQLGLGDAQNRGGSPGEMGDALPIVKLFSALW